MLHLDFEKEAKRSEKKRKEARGQPEQEGEDGDDEDAKAEIKSYLLQQKTDDELENWLNSQRNLADIRVREERIGG